MDVYDVNGKLLHHLVSNGAQRPLDAPWGLAIAPKGFGPFAGDLLVGNLGNGWINAFNPTTGKYLGALDTTKGTPIAISGLWGIEVGNSAFGGVEVAGSSARVRMPTTTASSASSPRRRAPAAVAGVPTANR